MDLSPFVLRLISVLALVCGMVVAHDEIRTPDAKDILAGGWRAMEILGNAANRTQHMVEFGRDGSLTGFGGCNHFRAGVTVRGSKISLTEMYSTAISCRAVLQERTFVNALLMSRSWSINQVSASLTLSDVRGRAIVVFSRLPKP